MGTYVFRWTAPAEEVYVTGTFDKWSKSVKLTKDSGVFTKQVDLPSTSDDIFYKFVVDGNWTVDPQQPTKKDDKGNENNLLRKEDIKPLPAGARSHAGQHPTANPASAPSSNVGPSATSATLAGAVPLEKNRGASSHEHMPGEFPSDSPFKETPNTFRGGPSAMEFFSPGDIVPDFSTYKSATLPTDPPKQSNQKDSGHLGEKVVGIGAGITGAAAAAGTGAVTGAKKAGEVTGIKSLNEGEQKFSVNPLPATSGIGNPIHVAPGEKLPPSQEYTSNTVTSNVKLDKESYEKPDAYPHSQNTNVDTTAGAFGVPPVTSTTIPESSLPMGKDAVSSGPADVAAIRSAAGSHTTTGQLAGQVSLEPRGVPEVVRDSQQEAQTSPEASANPTATAEKSATEKELKSKVPEEPATSEDSTPKGAGAGILAGGAAIASGAAAAAAGVPSAISNAVSGLTGGSSDAQPSSEVPDTVKDSENAARASPEAAANPEAVREKRDVEKELTGKIPRSDAAGEPAPPISVAQYASAPQPQEGEQGGRGKDHNADAGTGHADDGKASNSLSGKAAAIGAGVTGAAAAAGGAAYAATQKAGETAKSTVQEATSTTKSASAFANDPTRAESSTEPTIADEGTIAAISAVNTTPVKDTSHKVAPAFEDDPVSAGGTGAATGGLASAPKSAENTAKEADGLNASKDQPAKSAVTEAKQTASKIEPPETKKEEHGPLPGTTMLPSSAKAKSARQDSRDVSPMTRPEITTGTDKATTESQSKGKTHTRTESSVTTGSTADANDKKAKRRSFFGKIKDKLKHHE